MSCGLESGGEAVAAHLILRNRRVSPAVSPSGEEGGPSVLLPRPLANLQASGMRLELQGVGSERWGVGERERGREAACERDLERIGERGREWIREDPAAPLAHRRTTCACWFCRTGPSRAVGSLD